ncbi:hypothetical protein L3Q82_000498 [Scortum barcoo]|uniref:Uncharacterized protein n=1 Tax=Scortum barcoo TaxID=214431 RepID=A0ACB8WF32_9TELE|nr:hypothetical protein L3Q82_000498 [Scortum barcoo]
MWPQFPLLLFTLPSANPFIPEKWSSLTCRWAPAKDDANVEPFPTMYKCYLLRHEDTGDVALSHDTVSSYNGAVWLPSAKFFEPNSSGPQNWLLSRLPVWWEGSNQPQENNGRGSIQPSKSKERMA